jgi:phosphate-selective porin OprO/OprP
MGKNFRFVFFCLCLLAPAATSAGPLADQKLLDFLKANGALTEQQARDIKQTLDEEDKQASQLQAEKEAKEVKVSYDEGLKIGLQDKSFEMGIGGLIQADYLMFQNSYPIDNDFDIRRARLWLYGRIFRDFSYRLEAELEGSSSNRLIDAYINYDAVPWLQVRMGQFKEPFSFEQLTADKNLVFTERSMGFYLTPGRDVGLMLHGSLYDEAIMYGIGVFNGDGTDADRRSQKDEKQVTGRLVFKPLQHWGPDFLKTFQVGGSYSASRLDTSDFTLKIKTPARTTFFTVQPRAKFHMTEEIDDLNRYGFEMAYTLGPVALMAEYIKNDYGSVKLSDTEPFDFSLRSWYAGMLVMLTGERPELKGGVLGKIRPIRDFNIRTGGWGAWGLGCMYQQFEAEKIVYESLVYEGNSVREANSLTVALNWYLNSMARLSLNYSRTRFRDPLFLGNDADGNAYYRDVEHAWMARLQLEF